MTQIRNQHYRSKSVSADTTIKTGPGVVARVIVTASAAGVIRLYDNTAASGTVVLDQMSVVAGQEIELFVEFDTGLFFDLVSGTATVTVIFT